MKVVVFTTMNADYWGRFGGDFVDGFVENWPEEVHLRVFYEDWEPPEGGSRVSYHDLKDVGGMWRWIERHADDPKKNGIVERGGKVVRDYRFDALRYCKVVFPLKVLMSDVTVDWLIRLDPDVVFKKPLPMEELERRLEPDRACGYLGRKDWPHSETGFVAFNLKRGGDRVISKMVDIYETDAIFRLDGWTDCHAFDAARKHVEDHHGPRSRNFSEGVPGMHVWPRTWLGEYMEHLKGPAAKEGVRGLNDVPRTNVEQAVHAAANFKPRSIVDVGGHDGTRLIEMAKASLWAQGAGGTVRAWAVDRVGDPDLRTNLEAHAASEPRFMFEVVRGGWSDLRGTGLDSADFAYVDGGQEVDVLREDLAALRNCKLVLTPTYFLPEEPGSFDTSALGCNSVLDGVAHKIMPVKEVVEHEGKRVVVRTAALGHALTKEGNRVRTKNAVPDEVIKANVSHSLKHDEAYVAKQAEEILARLEEAKKVVAELEPQIAELETRRTVPFARQCRIHDLTAVILSGGPSLMDPNHPGHDRNWETVRELRDVEDHRVFAVKTCHDLMIYEKGIVPHGCLLLDPRPHVPKFVSRPHPGVTYLAASMCAPETWDLLLEKAEKVVGYNATVMAGEMEHVAKVMKHKGAIFFGGGSSSGSRGIGLLNGLGFRKFKLVGWDGCVWSEEGLDLKEQDEAGNAKWIRVTVNGREFLSQPIWLANVQDLEQAMRDRWDCDYEVLTDGMAMEVWKRVNRQKGDYEAEFDL